MNTKIFFSIIILIAIFVSSCSSIKEIENYKGDNISIGVGDTSSVNMDSDTQSGYDWIISANSDPSIAKFSGKENINTENKRKTVQVLRFKGLKKGKTIITLNYVKKGDMLVKKTRTLNITVY